MRRSVEQTRRRELRRRWNQGPPEPVVARPGARFYVTARMGRRAAALLGPYSSHMAALGNVDRARRLLADSRYPERHFAEVGTASLPRTVGTVFGR